MSLLLLGAGNTRSSITSLSPPSGSSIWLRANDESYSNGANVTQWSDRSGNSRHFTIGSNYPTFSTSANNGKSAITFNGTNQGLNRSYTGSGTDYTIAGIISQDSDTYKVWWQNGVAPYAGMTVGRRTEFYRGTTVNGITQLPWINWMPIIIRVSGTTASIYQGTTRVGTGAVTSGALAVAGLGNLASFFWPGKMQEIIAYGSALSDAEMAILANYLLDQAGKTDTPRQIVCEGDSLTQGVAPATPWPDLLQTSLGATGYAIRNVATGGNTIVSVAGSNGNISSQTSTVDPYLGTSRLDAKKQICVVWAGTNDIYYGRTGAQAHADYKTYCQARQAAGGRVFAVNMIDSVVEASWTVAGQSAFNSLFASEAATYSDVQFDLASIFSDHTNTTYYTADGRHLTTAANTVIAGLIQAAILAA